MKKAILINKRAGTGKVMLFEKPHTNSPILFFVPNRTECEILEGPMKTEDNYPGIKLYKIKTADHEGYVNVKYVKVRR